MVIIIILIAAKADVDKAGNDGCTPTYIAAQKRLKDAVQALVAAKAQIDNCRDSETLLWLLSKIDVSLNKEVAVQLIKGGWERYRYSRVT